MMASGLQGMIGIERMCRLAGVSRAGYYRHWQASSPRREEAGLRDAIQRLALANPHYGYRRIAVLLGREGWRANHKRVLRLMREDNLLCLRKAGFVPMTTDSGHGWRVVPNLAGQWQPTSRPSWRSRHSTRRLRCAGPRQAASSTTAIAACNMPALNTLHDLQRIASSRA
jgi:transposase InsO family protein